MPPSTASTSRLKKAISLVNPSLLSIHSSLPPNAYVLGIDASVRCSGIALVNAQTGAPFRVAISRTQTKAPPLFAGGRLAAAVRAICSSRTVDPVRIIETSLEEIPMQFKASSSSSMTRFALARVNGVAAYECWKFSGGAPVQFHYPNAMRSFFGIKPQRKTIQCNNEEGELLMSSSSSSTKSNDNKKAVLEKILSLQPNLLTGIEEVVAKSGSQGVADEFKSPMAWLEGNSSLLRVLTQKEANATKFDVADATLAALYGLATHLTFRTAISENGRVFATVAEEMFPKNSNMLQSIIDYHVKSCLIEEARERLQPGQEDLSINEEIDASIRTKKKMTRTTLKRVLVLPSSTVEKDPEILESPPRTLEEIERNYRKVRTLFDKACQSILLSGSVFPLWNRFM